MTSVRGEGWAKRAVSRGHVVSPICLLASNFSHQKRMGCSLLTTRVTRRTPQSPGASLAACWGGGLAGGSLNAMAVTIVNSRSIVRSLWLFMTSLFAGAAARRSINSEVAGQLITVLEQGPLTPSAQLQGREGPSGDSWGVAVTPRFSVPLPPFQPPRTQSVGA